MLTQKSGPAASCLRVMEDVLERLRRGDPKALAQVYDAYAPVLYRYAVTLLLNSMNAEDAVQNTFVKLVAAANQGGCRIENLTAYLYRAVHNEAMMIVRRKETARDEVLEATEGSEPGLAEAVRQALSELPPEQREVVVLRVYNDLTFREIAEVTGEKLDTVASRYKYAIEKLSQKMRAER